MRTLKFVIVLLAFSAQGYLFAQEAPTRGPARDPNTQSTRPKNFEGCVIRSNNSIMLTDANGTDYKLVSTQQKLDGYVGEEVRVTAIGMNANDPSSGEHDVPAQGPQPSSLDVSDIQKLSDHCKSPK